MKAMLKILVAVLLIFNGTGAIYGGWNLIQYPDGSSLHMAQGYLQYSPFQSYLIPGIILFVANGVCSFVVLGMILFKAKKYPWFVMAQGAILTGWILIQMIMVRMIFYLHIVLGVAGMLLMVGGWLLYKMNKKQSGYPFDMTFQKNSSGLV